MIHMLLLALLAGPTFLEASRWYIPKTIVVHKGRGLTMGQFIEEQNRERRREQPYGLHRNFEVVENDASKYCTLNIRLKERKKKKIEEE